MEDPILLQYPILITQLGPREYDRSCCHVEKQESKDQLHKWHNNRDVFKHVAQKMQVQDHNRVQCWKKKKWMKIQYKFMHDTNKNLADSSNTPPHIGDA